MRVNIYPAKKALRITLNDDMGGLRVFQASKDFPVVPFGLGDVERIANGQVIGLLNKHLLEVNARLEILEGPAQFVPITIERVIYSVLDQLSRDAAAAAQTTANEADGKADVNTLAIAALTAATGITESQAQDLIADWAEQGNTDAIPADKLTNAPASGLDEGEVNARILSELPTATQAQAEAVTGTTRRVWTLQRIRQLIGSYASDINNATAIAGTSTARHIWSSKRVRQAINAVVPMVFRSGNTDTIADAKLPTTIARDSEIEDWARDDTTLIPASKLTNAPGGGTLALTTEEATRVSYTEGMATINFTATNSAVDTGIAMPANTVTISVNYGAATDDALAAIDLPWFDIPIEEWNRLDGVDAGDTPTHDNVRMTRTWRDTNVTTTGATSARQVWFAKGNNGNIFVMTDNTGWDIHPFRARFEIHEAITVVTGVTLS